MLSTKHVSNPESKGLNPVVLMDFLAFQAKFLRGLSTDRIQVVFVNMDIFAFQTLTALEADIKKALVALAFANCKCEKYTHSLRQVSDSSFAAVALLIRVIFNSNDTKTLNEHVGRLVRWHARPLPWTSGGQLTRRAFTMLKMRPSPTRTTRTPYRCGRRGPRRHGSVVLQRSSLPSKPWP